MFLIDIRFRQHVCICTVVYVCFHFKIVPQWTSSNGETSMCMEAEELPLFSQYDLEILYSFHFLTMLKCMAKQNSLIKCTAKQKERELK